MLKQSEKSIPDVSRSNGSFCLQTDMAGIILFASSRLLNFTGKHEYELLGNSFREIMGTDDSYKMPDILTLHSFSEATVISLVIRGKEQEQEVQFTVEKEYNGKQPGVLNWGAFLPGEADEPVTRQQFIRYQASILENIFDAVTATDPEFNVRSWNHAAEKLYGIGAEEITGRKLSDFVQLNYHNTTREELLKELYTNGAWTGECSFTRPKDNKTIIFISSVSLIKNADNNITDIIAINRDITDSKQARHVIQESEERFRQLADAAPVMIWVSDENDATVYVNKCWKDFTGVPGNEISDNGWINLVHPEDTHIAIEEYKKYFKSQKPVKLEYRLKNKDGEYRWVVDHAVPRFLEDGTFKGYTGSVFDIHDRKMAEEKIRFQVQVIQDVSDGIVSTDLDFRVISFNKAAEKMYGISAEEILGQPIRDMIVHHYITCTREEALQQLYDTEKWEGQFYYDREDGKRVFMHCALAYVKDEDGKRIGFAGIHRDITEQRESEEALRISEERYRSVVHALGEGILVMDRSGEIIACNRSAEEMLGAGSQQLIGRNPKIVSNVSVHEDGTPFPVEEYPAVITLETGQSLQNVILGVYRADGSLVWLSINTEPIYYTEQRIEPNAVVVSLVNITERKKLEQLLELEKEVLKINTESSVSLKTTIDCLLEGLEKIFPGMLCSVLTLNDDKVSLSHLSAPSLAGEYTRSIEGIKIGPSAGSCGTAMFRKERVITTNINTDPLWAEYLHLAQPYGLQACWSLPVLDARNEVLATIATYYTEPRVPTEKELSILDRISSLLQVIIVNKTAEIKIRLSNERYLLVTKATNDAIWDWDVATNILYWGEGFYNLFGHRPGYIDNSIGFWESHIHDNDRARIMAGLKRFVDDNNSQIWEDEYMFRKANGEYALVYDRGFLIYDHAGKIHRMVGSMQDITDKREMEKKLLKQELDKQKLVAQAVVDAQEKERAEIGKELHDNVNQILSTAKLYLDLAKTEDRERLELISRSSENISDAINEIRNISRSLVPPSVGDLGLIDSVKDLVENIKATRKLHVEFYYEGDIDRLLDEKKKLMLFRIIQEQVNNVLKHAEANTLVIELIVDGPSIDLTISDDGKGFETDKVRIIKGVGLSNISSRAELFNGKVNIVTGRGKGCKLNINVPI